MVPARDFGAGIPQTEIQEGQTVAGYVGEDPVLLSRVGGEFFAVSSVCSHYGASLAAGTIHEGSVRCPLHHACFDLRDGSALRAPALDPLDRWRVETEGEQVIVREKLKQSAPGSSVAYRGIDNVVIIGGGAAGLACAHQLRVQGYKGRIRVVSADKDPPCDRPNLSKDFLAGAAPEEWLPLRDQDWYSRSAVELSLGVEVQRIDTAMQTLHLNSGGQLAYDRLLIATGSRPVSLDAPGFDGEDVFTLRTLADARAIADRLRPGIRVGIIGASFIGLEAAAALRTRGVEVCVVSLEQIPFEGVFGSEVGKWLQHLHAVRGVDFHLGKAAASHEENCLVLADGTVLETDLVLVAIGVRPCTAIAEAAGIPTLKGGVLVDQFLETCVPGVFAAGDVALYPDPLSGEPIRIEHWVTAERQGQTVAANMLGAWKRFDAVPFFWTEQYGNALRYVGHAREWDSVEIDGDLDSESFVARYFNKGVHCASAAVGRDLEILEDEQRFEDLVGERSKDCGLLPWLPLP